MANVVKHKEKHHFQGLNVIFPCPQRVCASAAGYTLGPPLGSQNPLKIECFSIKVLGSILSAKMPQNGSQNGAKTSLFGDF